MLKTTSATSRSQAISLKGRPSDALGGLLPTQPNASGRKKRSSRMIGWVLVLFLFSFIILITYLALPHPGTNDGGIPGLGGAKAWGNPMQTTKRPNNPIDPVQTVLTTPADNGGADNNNNNNNKRYNGNFTNDNSNINYDVDKWIAINLAANEMDQSNEVFQKRMKIRETFIKAYSDYDRHCHGQDELVPIGPRCHNWVGLGLTILDALDTMYIMGLNDMFTQATQWVKESLNFNRVQSVSFFETTIRCLGGLMSIYDLTSEQVFLDKAKDLAIRLSPVFNTGNGLPLSEVNLANGNAHAAQWTGGSLLLAEVGTIQLEFKSCADRSKEPSIGLKAVQVFEKLDPMRGGPKLPLRGQFPIYIDSHRMHYRNNHVTWGAMGDSFYEYLLKYYIYEGKKDEALRKMYIEASDGMLDHLYRKHEASGLYYIAEWRDGRMDNKMDELACFTGGTLALGVMHEVLEDEKMAHRHLEAAKQLGETCYQMFARQKSGLSPEFVRFDHDVSNGVDFYILRPETIETFFYLWRLTGQQKWRDYGWKIYESIENRCRVKEPTGAGYVPILSVGHSPRQDPKGVMHSYFLAETLKYLYLLFSHPNLIPLDVYVFNTEAHPIRIATTL